MAQVFEKGLEAYQAEKFEVAISLFKETLAQHETDSAAHYYLGSAYSQIGEYTFAEKHLKRAMELKFNQNLVYNGLLSLNAKLNTDAAFFKTLDEAVQNGYIGFIHLKNGEEFKKYQEYDRFVELFSKVEENAYPCLTSNDARHFDFWIGNWDVYLEDVKVGENFITKAQGGCAIHENYVTERIYAGQSINYFDPIDQKWHQHWVGSSGDVYNYIEIDRGPDMLQFLSDFKDPFTGEISLSRLTFTKNADDTVSQVFESSTDKGATWSKSFDGKYIRKKD